MGDNRKELYNVNFSMAAAHYDHERRYQALRQSYSTIMAEAFQAPFTSVLDIGCGTGALLSMIRAGRPDARLFGIDLSTEMITHARARREIQRLAAGAGLAVSSWRKLNWHSYLLVGRYKA